MNLTTADLSSEQQAMLKSYAEVARQIQVKGNKQALDDMMKDILTYEQQRLKITEEYGKNVKASMKQIKTATRSSVRVSHKETWTN